MSYKAIARIELSIPALETVLRKYYGNDSMKLTVNVGANIMGNGYTAESVTLEYPVDPKFESLSSSSIDRDEEIRRILEQGNTQIQPYIPPHGGTDQ